MARKGGIILADHLWTPFPKFLDPGIEIDERSKGAEPLDGCEVGGFFRDIGGIDGRCLIGMKSFADIPGRNLLQGALVEPC